MITILLSLGILVWWIVEKKIIPTSLSETYYIGGGSTKFTTMMIMSGLLILKTMLMEGPWWLAIPLVGSLILVGCFPDFKEEDRILHYIGALSAMILAQLWITIVGYWWLIGLLLLPWYLSKKNWLFWVEMTCFLEIYTNEILKQIL